METNRTKGAVLLREWVEKPDAGRSQTELAKLLGVSQPSVSAWLRGESRPEDHHREAIEIITGIPRGLWRRDAEQSVVERVRVGASFAASDFDVAPSPTLPATGTGG